MSDFSIQVNNLSKLYHIGKKQEQYRTLRDTIMSTVTAPVRRIGNLLRGQASSTLEQTDTIWALKDVSFDIKRGEVVGIIGRNGAGKSTLLKILSRITEPTTGVVDIYGRVGSLLEVGTGFHKELSGRENIYLNGAILGMKRTEIDQKFDEIVDFAEVEKFIDTPVKHYSSGMYLRLAFAVAAHLEPEILLVDEVLAVGDARFQKKCLDKMQDVGAQGRTVLFVSHSMPSITRLCERAILLDQGQVVEDGASDKVVMSYLNAGLGMTSAREWTDPGRAPGGDVARLRAVRIKTQSGQVEDTFDIRHPIGIEMEYEVLKSGYMLLPHYDVYNDQGILIFKAMEYDLEWRRRARPAGRYISTAWIPGNFLAEGMLYVSPAVVTLNPVQLEYYENDAVAFQVADSFEGDSVRGDWGGRISGVVRPQFEWTTEYDPAK